MKDNKPHKLSAHPLFVADIGGTHARFGIATLTKRRVKLLLTASMETGRIKNLPKAVNTFLDLAERELKIKVRSGVISVAGPLMVNGRRRSIKLTNGSLVVSEEIMKSKTLLNSVRVINDFYALALATSYIPKGSIKVVRKGKFNWPRVLIGAGTGLGQAVILNDQVLASEGSYAIFPFLTSEQRLARFFEKRNESKSGERHYVKKEMVLSGRGLEHLYIFLNPRSVPLSAEEISRRREEPRSKATLALFSTLFARVCRDFIIETCSWGGLYLAGGVVEKNPKLFGRTFVRELSSHSDANIKRLLGRVPIRLIKEENAGLIGATVEAIR